MATMEWKRRLHRWERGRSCEAGAARREDAGLFGKSDALVAGGSGSHGSTMSRDGVTGNTEAGWPR